MPSEKKRPAQKTRGKAISSSHASAAGYSPRVVVRFKDGFLDGTGHPYEDNILDRIGDPQWRDLKRRFHDLRIRKLFTSVTPDRISELVTTAQVMDSRYLRPDFLAYFIVDCQSAADAHQIADEMSRWTNVRKAYFDPPGSEPGVNPDGDVLAEGQLYLNEAKKGGIDARYAWTILGGDGAGQSLIDLERGWDFAHTDLKDHFTAQTSPLLYGEIRKEGESVKHGTEVLGVICGVDNDKGILGIVPNLSSVSAVSYYGQGKSRTDAMMAAIDKLPFGGVLLLEAQLGGEEEGLGSASDMLPIEILDAEFEVIRLASALGIVVIEAAGNGGQNLDTTDHKMLKRNGSAFQDSGAIMVGAVKVYSNGIKPLPESNHGSRIDCVAAGANVYTTISQDAYTAVFDGTSSASAIIAGAALAVQGVIQMKSGSRLDGFRMREILSDKINTQAEAGAMTKVMPDLRRIIDKLLADGFQADNKIKYDVDVYIKDFASDTGDPFKVLPSKKVSASPGIIISLANSNYPQTGTIKSGKSYQIRLKLWNRGVADSGKVKARIYCWSEKVIPNWSTRWKLLGEDEVEAIPANNGNKKTEPVLWNPSDLPPDSYYLVAVLDVAVLDKFAKDDYFPSIVETPDFNQERLEEVVRRNNKVACRRIKVSA